MNSSSVGFGSLSDTSTVSFYHSQPSWQVIKWWWWHYLMLSHFGELHSPSSIPV